MTNEEMANKKSKRIAHLKKAGRKGAEAINSDPIKKSAATKKAAATRKKQNPNVFRMMGKKGGTQKKKNFDKSNKKLG